MIKKDNRSLLSRLVGSGSSDDSQNGDADEDIIYEESVEEGELLDEQDREEDAEEDAVKPQTNPTQVTPAKPQEGWMADYEGQLNIDMYQTKDNVIIKSTVAGVRPEDLDITVANDVVTVKGSRKREEDAPQDDYFYQECYWGSFSRSVIVPVDIDSEHIEADLKDGMLTIVIPKAAKAKTKKVKVRGL